MNTTASDCFNLHGDLVTNVTHREDVEFEPIFSDHIVFIFQIVVNVFTNGVISIFGSVANVFNIIVFIRQGIFTESGTAGIFCLAVSDLCCVFSMLWLCVIEAVVLANPSNLSWDPTAVKTATAFWVHIMFATITRVVMVYIAFERCVCVLLPFKVKTLLNPQRTIIIISFVFTIIGSFFIPVFIAFQLGFTTDFNSTRLVIIINEEFQSIALDRMVYVTGYATNIASVVAVFVCTIITAIRINLSKTWRESVSAGTSINNTKPIDKQRNKNIMPSDGQKQSLKSKLTKETRLVRMIVIISVIFLICYIPLLVYLIMITVNKDLGLRGKYKNFSSVMYTLTFLMESINSSINIIIYYNMSSRFREELRKFCGLRIVES